MSLLIDTLLEIIRKEYKKEKPKWRISSSMNKINKMDWMYLINESKKNSEFDPMNLRMKMINEMKEGKLEMDKAECEYGQVIIIYDTEIKREDIPWELWGRILRMYSDKKDHQPCKIYVLASSQKREFPERGTNITAQNINGGYTYTCNKETIMIYRAEDATRVLLHELQHSCCLDDKNKGVDEIEAETEAWAELLYIAFLSKGNMEEMKELLKKQIDWILNQNRKVKSYMKDTNSKEFPWRYTIGKEEVWKRWGLIRKNTIGKNEVGESLRLTRPPDQKYKKEMKVRIESTIL
jgi:hypothetical protein